MNKCTCPFSLPFIPSPLSHTHEIWNTSVLFMRVTSVFPLECLRRQSYQGGQNMTFWSNLFQQEKSSDVIFNLYVYNLFPHIHCSSFIVNPNFHHTNIISIKKVKICFNKTLHFNSIIISEYQTLFKLLLRWFILNI